MFIWGRRQPDLSPWQAFVWRSGGANHAVLDGCIVVVSRFGGSVAAVAQLDGDIVPVASLDASVEVQG